MFRKITFTTTNNTKTDDDAMILSAPLEIRGVVGEEEGSDRHIRVVHDLGSRVHADVYVYVTWDDGWNRIGK